MLSGMFAYAELLTRLKSRRGLGIAGAGVAVAALVGWAASHQTTAVLPTPVADNVPAPAQAATVLVFVSGAVAHPGLYQLSPDARVADAIAAAGGVTSLADPGRLPDLASRVHDGRQVNVPLVRSGSSSTARLDINSAAADELDALPDMPPGLGEAIVEYRHQWGPFTSLSQLRTDLGVDSATLSGVGHYLRVIVSAP